MEKSINTYNRRILKLWNDSQDSVLPKDGWGTLLPMFYDGDWFEKFRESENRILIVGCNPSFSEKGKHKSRDIDSARKLLNFKGNDNQIQAKIDSLHAFKRQRKGFAAKRKDILELQAGALGLRIDRGVEAIPYFSAITDFVLDLKSNFLESLIENQIICFSWAHVDLLAMRATEQKKIKMFCDKAFDSKTKKVKAKQQNDKNKKFIREQIEYFLNLVSALKPTLIIVASAYASSLLREHFVDIFRTQPYDPEQNFYAQEVRFKNFHSHVIFSSMFSGGHMTGGIRDLLAWNVGRFLHHKTLSVSSKITT